MEENNNIDKGSSRLRDKFQMDPPENAWNMLDAELERKQGIRYKQRGNRFKLLSIGLALLLISAVTYYYIYPDHQSTVLSVANKSAGNIVNDDKANAGIKSLAENNAEANAASVAAPAVPKGGLGTWNGGNSASVPRSSYAGVKHKRESNGAIALSAPNSNAAASNQEQRNGDDNEKNAGGNDEKVNAPATPGSTVNNDPDKKNPGETSPSVITPAVNSEKETANEEKAVPEASLANVNSETSRPSKDSTNTKMERNKSRWAISAFYSPNYYAQNHLVADDPAYAESASDYGTREKATYSFASGLALRYNLTPHWSVSVGGTYSTIAYSINLPSVYAKYGSDDQLHYEYPTSCGNIVMPNTGSSSIYYGDTLNINGACQQVVKFINVPVSIRYEVTSNRFTFYISGGVSANYVVQEKASVNVWNTETTIVNSVDGLKKMNYGYLFGGGVEYAFYPGWGIFIEPSFRGSITSLTDNIAYYCYPNAFGLNTGVSFHF